MRGYDIYSRALQLLNFDEAQTKYKNKVPDIALGAVNEIGADLLGDFKIENIFDEVHIPDNAFFAFVNGVAMILSVAFNMFNQNAYFTTVYNQKRTAVKAANNRIKNSIPCVSEGIK